MAEFRIGSAYVEVSARDNTDRDTREIERRINRISAHVTVNVDRRSTDSAKAAVKGISDEASLLPGVLKASAIGFGGFAAAGAGAGVAVAGALAAVPLAFGAIGVAAAAQSDKVKTAFTGLKDHVVGEITKMSAPFIPVLTNIATMFRTTFDQLAPQIGGILKSVAPMIGELATGLNSFIINAMPGFTAAIGAAKPIIDALAIGMRDLGTGLTGFFQGLASGAPGAAAAFGAVFQVINGLLPVIGQLLGTLANTLGPVFVALAPLVVQLAQTLGGMLGSALQALGPPLLTIAQALTSALAPVLPVIGQLFAQLAPIIGQIVTALVTALVPILPIVSNLLVQMAPIVAQVATQIGGALLLAIQTLAPLLPPLAQVFSDLILAVAPIIPMLIQFALQLFQAIMPFLPPLVVLFTRLIREAILPLIPPILQLISSLLPPLIDLFTWLAPIILQVGTWLIDKLVYAITKWVVPAIIGLIDWVRSIMDRWGEFKAKVAEVWDSVVQKITGAKDWIVKNVFGPFQTAIHNIGQAFQDVGDWIGRAWESIKEKARGPVQYVIDVVYNNGVRRVWNGIASVFGGNPLGEVHLARGGLVPGQDRGYDYVPAMLRGGEGVLVPEAVRAVGGAPGIDRLNRMAERQHFAGGGVAGFSGSGSAGATRNFATGSTTSASAWDKITGLWTDGPEKWAKNLFSSVLGDAGRTPGQGSFRDALVKLPQMVLEKVIAKAKDLFSSGGMQGVGPGGGAGVQRWSGLVLQALAMMGQPAGLLPVVLRRMNQESGGNPGIVNRWDINAKRGTPSGGLMQVIGPTFAAYRDPRAPNSLFDPLANVLASMRYAMARYGSLSAAYNRAGGYDLGGVANGVGMMPKYTSEPERVLSPAQTQAFERLVDHLTAGGGAMGDRPVVVNVMQSSGSPAETGRFVALALRSA